MKYLIVGLGNIGEEYNNTRHNIGFEVLDALAGASNLVFTPDRLASVTTLKHRGRQLLLVKPSTYMNLSGKALNYWMQKEKIPLERVLIITDDLALPFGKLRLRAKGSDGGHNGLKNINAVLGRTDYARLRFGVGADFASGQQVKYVLDKWNSEEQVKLKERVQLSTEIILSFASVGVERTMSGFNNK